MQGSLYDRVRTVSLVLQIDNFLQFFWLDLSFLFFFTITLALADLTLFTIEIQYLF